MTGDFDLKLDEFRKVVIELNNFQSFTKSLANKFSAYQQSLEDNNIIKKRNEFTGNEWSASINFLIKDYGTGSLSSWENNEFTMNDLRSFELELKNRQYQFLLLHAFEAFEKYLKFAASQIGYNEKNFSPIAFIKHLHKTIPVVSTIIKIRNENNTKFLDELNLLLTFSLIEQLRHQITHANGYANNKEMFIKKRLNRIGRYNNGKPELEYSNYLNSFFGSKKYENLICLIEVKSDNNSFFHHDRLGDLITELASYIMFVHGHINNLISPPKTP